MDQVFPYANVVAGVLVLMVGFVLHWIGQLVSVCNWDFATRLGLQEKGMPPEFRVYEHAIAGADAVIGWVYGIAGIGLILGTPWGYKLAMIPGSILLYHGISFLFWTGNQRRIGLSLVATPFRFGWSLTNIIGGLFTLIVAWTGV